MGLGNLSAIKIDHRQNLRTGGEFIKEKISLEQTSSWSGNRVGYSACCPGCKYLDASADCWRPAHKKIGYARSASRILSTRSVVAAEIEIQKRHFGEGKTDTESTPTISVGFGSVVGNVHGDAKAAFGQYRSVREIIGGQPYHAGAGAIG